MKLDDALLQVRRLAFDTAPLIYFVEARTAYDALVTSIFERVDRGTLTGITSTITLAEVLVHPLRHGNQELQREYRSLLLGSRNMLMFDIDSNVASTAAELRARYPIRTPDALQLATALEAGCEAFLTNDKQLQRVSELQVLVLDDLEL